MYIICQYNCRGFKYLNRNENYGNTSRSECCYSLFCVISTESTLGVQSTKGTEDCLNSDGLGVVVAIWKTYAGKLIHCLTRLFLGSGTHSTVDSILASRSAAPGLIPDFFQIWCGQDWSTHSLESGLCIKLNSWLSPSSDTLWQACTTNRLFQFVTLRIGFLHG